MAESEDQGKLERFLGEPRNVMVAAIRADGRPQMTPNWYDWDGTYFYVSTTKDRQKYRNFSRDFRVQLAFDDPAGFKTVLVDGAVEIREDLEPNLRHFKSIMTKHGHRLPSDAKLLDGLNRENRVLLVIKPDRPPEEWTTWGL
ncbi:MAG TPA: PPOX class F420-dependent oxidoreductase [Dehalococcoidia bacterium]|nr:PPOX class F420-dependent oxidoreductase [Dehalococcoidia bacterium]